MKTRHFAPACLLLAIFIIAHPLLISSQDPQATAPVFPDSYIDGSAKFDLAIDLQGDLRGNFGPCG